MRDRYPPHGPAQDWPAISPARPGIHPSSEHTLRLGPDTGSQPGGRSRADGLRRLSRLTWRSTQLSAIAAAAFAILFARSAPAQTASSEHPVRLPSTAAPAVAPAPAAKHTAAHHKHHTHRAPVNRPATQPSSAVAQPATAAPTLAPPTTPPAAAPSPSPVQSTSSGTHSGG
jgi:hypothetical protein